MVCGLLIYARLFEVPEDGLQLFAIKRCPPNMSASELRYLYYLSNIVRNPPLYPHCKPLTLISLQMQPVPLFTKIRLVPFIISNLLSVFTLYLIFRDGCRPYLEVFNESRCILSTLQDYERMRLYNITEGRVCMSATFNNFCPMLHLYSVFVLNIFQCIINCHIFLINN